MLGVVGVTLMAFFLTAAGPYGIEPCVQSAGPLITLLALLIMPFIFALPIGYLTAELSCMISANGGYVLWVQDAFGDVAGWVNAWNALLSNIIDLPIYVVLVTDYLAAYMEDHGKSLDPFVALAIKLAVIALVLVFNMRGMSVLSIVAGTMAYLVTIPFLILIVAIIAEGRLDLGNDAVLLHSCHVC